LNDESQTQETKEESRDESRRNQAGTGESSSLTRCGFTLLTTYATFLIPPSQYF